MNKEVSKNKGVRLVEFLFEQEFSKFYIRMVVSIFTAYFFHLGNTQAQLAVSASMNIGVSGSLGIHCSELYVLENGEITNNGSIINKADYNFLHPGCEFNGNGTLFFNSNQLQELDANGSEIGCNIEIDNANGLHLSSLAGPGTSVNNDLLVTQTLTFTIGHLFTLGNKVVFGNNGGYSSVSDDSHVVGWVEKIGNTPFVFPVGNQQQYRPAEISSPASLTDRFLCRYEHQNPGLAYNDLALDPTLDHISSCEYWIIDRTVGSSSVQVSLSWNASTSCGVSDLSELRVARWNGSIWKDHGNGGTAGNLSNGTILSAGTISSFSPFTLSSITSANPLPVTFLSLSAIYNADLRVTDLIWKTASEQDNAFFTVERSSDVEHWENIATVDGAGTSVTLKTYFAVDPLPLYGINYYRIRQTDFNGSISYSEIRAIQTGDFSGSSIVVYPTLFDDQFTIVSNGDEIVKVQLTNILGQNIYLEDLSIPSDTHIVLLPTIANGNYFLRIETKKQSFFTEMVKI